MCTTQVHCPQCDGTEIKNFGYSKHGIPRYRCCNDECETKTFVLAYRYKAYEPGIKKQVIEIVINGSGVRDTSRVLGINKKNSNKYIKKKAWPKLILTFKKLILVINQSYMQASPSKRLNLMNNGRLFMINQISVGCGTLLTKLPILFWLMFLANERIQNLDQAFDQKDNMLFKIRENA